MSFFGMQETYCTKDVPCTLDSLGLKILYDDIYIALYEIMTLEI